jgi:hypothetical protein
MIAPFVRLAILKLEADTGSIWEPIDTSSPQPTLRVSCDPSQCLRDKARRVKKATTPKFTYELLAAALAVRRVSAARFGAPAFSKPIMAAPK